MTVLRPSSIDDADTWTSLITAANPASMLVAIAGRIDVALRQQVSPEDIWQETLLRAWRSRQNLTWEGTAAFRRWLLAIAAHCIVDQIDRLRAQKRGGSKAPLSTSRGGDANHAVSDFEPWGSTTPSRLAIAREHAHLMSQALESLPDDVRHVVRLRLFEDLQIAEIAAKLELGESGVRHRFRKGAELYRARLRALGLPEHRSRADSFKIGR
jgi:RNA polymerase sigma factor (sigma-70 family)